MKPRRSNINSKFAAFPNGARGDANLIVGLRLGPLHLDLTEGEAVRLADQLHDAVEAARFGLDDNPDSERSVQTSRPDSDGEAS